MRRFMLMVAALCVALLAVFAVVEVLHVELLEDPTSALGSGSAGAALVGVGLLVVDVLVPVPSSVVMVAHGALFGVVLGTVLSLVGGVGAVLLGFAIGRRGGVLMMRAVPSEERRRADALLVRWGLLAIVVTRPVPVLAEAVVIIAGASPLGWRAVLVAGAAGSLPAALAYALAGSLAASYGNAAVVFLGVLIVAGVLWLVGGRSIRRAAASDPLEGVAS